jgi:hypothetical protein
MVLFGTQWLSNAGNFSLTLCVIWGKLLNLSGPQFSHFQKRDNNNSSLWWTFTLSCWVASSCSSSHSLQFSTQKHHSPWLLVPRIWWELHPTVPPPSLPPPPGSTEEHVTQAWHIPLSTNRPDWNQTNPGALTRASYKEAALLWWFDPGRMWPWTGWEGFPIADNSWGWDKDSESWVQLAPGLLSVTRQNALGFSQ